MTLATADLSDAYPDAQVCEPVFADYGGVLAFHGAIVTLKVFEDNAMVRATLERPGEGRVLVVDGGGSLRCALVGGDLGALAAKNGWAGLVVNGCIRDSMETTEQPIGVKALGTTPRKSQKGLHQGHLDRVVEFAGARFIPGGWLYADADGIVVTDGPIHG